MSCCLQRRDGVAPGGVASELREFTIDFREQGSRALVSGAETLITSVGNLAATALVAVGDTSTFTAGTGWVWDEGTTNTSWTAGTLTATSLSIDLADIFALLDTDSSWRYRMDVYFSALALLNAEYVNCCVYGVTGSPSNQGNRMAGGGRARQVATQVWRPSFGGSGVNYSTAPGGTTNVTSWIGVSNAMTAMAGTWTGSWESLRTPIMWAVGGQDGAETDSLFDQNGAIAIAFASQGVVGTSSLTCEQMRFQAMPFAA